MKSFPCCAFAFSAILAVTAAFNCSAEADQPAVPHGQSKPPGPALSPAEAVARMQVPPGFHVELVASEPNVMNPVAMTFDERGRAWITESFEYPRLSDGPGRDRIRILEDTDGDGQSDKVTTFAEGLNIPSGIAVGYGGVWVANAPDILFLQDTDGDDRADTTEVVVTGFGRDDTHELPNSLTWGPDGWLYGLNGVFNRSTVRDPVSGRELRFTCAMFRIHPVTHEFQLFCEGTSNPWGIAWNSVGDAFVSACVIDHLWHLAETGYYHRQGGPYPPFTWKIDSIVNYKHQQAAYCGITYFDSDAYPPEYRNCLMMGNIHGNCINVDRLHDHGATYKAEPADDLLTANDSWFMPVVQKTGPDGCLWILDWYDRYHCYQDARRDPDGLDRLKGRLYRIRYGNSPRAGQFNLTSDDDSTLISHLRSENVFFRETARRLLAERDSQTGNSELEKITLNTQESLRTRLNSFWARISASPVPDSFLNRVLRLQEPELKAWAVRAAGNQRVTAPDIRQLITELRHDSDPHVRMQVAVTTSKLNEAAAVPILTDILATANSDPLMPRILWQNLHPLLKSHTSEFVAAVQSHRLSRGAVSATESSGTVDTSRTDSVDEFPTPILEILPRAADCILSSEKPDTTSVVQLVRLLLQAPSAADSGNRCLQLLTQRVRSQELTGESLAEVRGSLAPALLQITAQQTDHSLFLSALELAASSGISQAVEDARRLILEPDSDLDRIRLLNAVITAGSSDALSLAESLLKPESAVLLQQKTVQAIGRIDSAEATAVLIRLLSAVFPEVQPTVLEAISDRTESSKALLNLVASGKFPAASINANQASKMLSMKDPELTSLVTRYWGTVRVTRDPARSRLISQMRNTLRVTAGDAAVGQTVFRRVCGQCHRIYGQGAEVGPDITRNGRASFEQLLSNVFDPNLVIGAAYQAQTVVTKDGRVITGLPIEDSPQRVVLKVQGDKQETIGRSEIEDSVRSSLSLMPEGLEKQLQPQELADLFAFLVLDRSPEDPTAAFLPGAVIPDRTSKDRTDYNSMVEQLLPGFSANGSGRDGMSLIPDYHGRPALRTHPLSRDEPCILTSTISIPSAAEVRLRIGAAADSNGDWQLAVRVNGRQVHQSLINQTNGPDGWQDVEIDLTELAGQTVRLELLNKANNWNDEFAYWNHAELYTTAAP